MWDVGCDVGAVTPPIVVLVSFVETTVRHPQVQNPEIESRTSMKSQFPAEYLLQMAWYRYCSKPQSPVG